MSYIECTDACYIYLLIKFFNDQTISAPYFDKNGIEQIISTVRKISEGTGIINYNQGSLYFHREYSNELKKENILGLCHEKVRVGKIHQFRPDSLHFK